MESYEVKAKERYYQHMAVSRLENIIMSASYCDYDGDIQKLIKTLDKKIKKRYNPAMDQKQKVKMLSKYRMGGKK